tara:strand:- start:6 stop:389 length:384 start_codon:yes stop_codon:yes gene_type:complete
LIDEKEIVQPIYTSDIIDNIPKKLNERRHSLRNEYNAMNKIRNELNLSFPFTKSTFLPLIDIKKINIDYDIKYHMNILKIRNMLEEQYANMVQFLNYQKILIIIQIKLNILKLVSKKIIIINIIIFI